MPSLSRYRSFAVSRLIVIGFACRRSLFPSHRTSNEQVKTAPADRSSVKPLQSVSVSCRHRIGCRMMSQLAARPLRHLPPSSCLLTAFSFASPIRLVLPPRRACRASFPCSPARVVLRLALPTRRSCRASLCPVSSRRLAPSCLPIEHVRFVSSAHPLASLCLLSPPLVSPDGASCVSLSSRHASRLSSCVLLAALRSAHPRDAIADIIASFLRSVAPCLSCGFSFGASVVPACYSFRPVVVSFGSPFVRQVGRGGSVCVSVWVRLGRCCLLLAVAGRGMRLSGSSHGCCSLSSCRWCRLAA